MKNIVQELFTDTTKGSYQRHPSPFTQCGISKQLNLVSGLRCDAYSVFSLSSGDADAHNNADMGVHACCAKISKSNESFRSQLLAVGDEDGRISVVDLAAPRTADAVLTPTNVKNVHQNAIMDLCWVPGEDKELLTAGGDKTVVLWRMAEGRLHSLLQLFGHTRSVKCVNVNPHDPAMFASGGRDSNIVVWDRRCGPNLRADEIIPAHPSQVSVSSPRFRKSAVASTPPPHPSSSALTNSVTSLLFTDQHSLLSAGASDGLIKVWDLRKTHAFMKSAPLPLHTLVQPPTFGKMGFSWMDSPANSHYVYALAMDHIIYAYHLGYPSTEPVARYTGCLNLSYYVKFAVSGCGRFLVSGSSDNKALVWLTGRPGAPVAQLGGHHGEVTAVDWGQNGAMDRILTCSDDFRHKIYEVKRTDPDDPDENFLIRGMAEPIAPEVKERCKKKADVLQKTETNPLPKTPRTARHNCQTPSRRKSVCTPGRSLLAMPTTPRQQPSDSPAPGSEIRSLARGCATTTPQTPSSVDKSCTLLQWLSSAKKTPRPAETTPGHSRASPTSATKRAGIKRKLTEVLDDPKANENTLNGCPVAKKIPISPSKNILSPSNEDSKSDGQKTPPVSAVKMLQYGKSKNLNIIGDLESIPEDSALEDSCQPFDNEMLDTLRKNSFRSSFSESKKISSVPDGSSNVQPESTGLELMLGESSSAPEEGSISRQMKSLFESPTANLPNFVKDGRSPHIRPVPVFPKKPPSNWLSNLSKARKLKYGETPEKESSSARKSKKKASVFGKSKKYLKIVPFPDSPSTESGNSELFNKKPNQTTLESKCNSQPND